MTDEIENGFQELLHCLENFIRSETVVGKPLTIGPTTVIPVFRVSLGLGAGSGGNGCGDKIGTRSGSSSQSSNQQRSSCASAGTGAGAGASIVPYAVISVTDGETTVLPLAKNSLEAITEMLPEILNQVKSRQGQS